MFLHFFGRFIINILLYNVRIMFTQCLINIGYQYFDGFFMIN